MAAIAKRSLVCVVLVVAMSLGLAAGAGAKQSRHHSKSHPSSAISLSVVGPDGVSGRVVSDSNACRAQREVILYRVNSVSSIPSGEFVAATVSGGDGSWTVPGPLYPSEYYAVLESKNTRDTVCGPATSNLLHWG
jgi:hypothetical protein